MITVEVKEVVQPVGLFDTIIKFRGVEVESGDEILFGVDHRPARGLAQHMINSAEAGEPALASIEVGQILMVLKGTKDDECEHLAIADGDNMVCTNCGEDLHL